jgi:copper chaperone NosL
MRKIGILGIITAVCFVFSAPVWAQVQDDVTLHRSCAHCGMDRGMFNFSRMLIQYDDGSSAAVCSLHCAAIDLANNIDKTPKSIRVADFTGKQLIDAEAAIWVVGGKKPGVMSKRGKWAFEMTEDAGRFTTANQGQLASFEEAIKMAYDDMYEDTKMIRQKRKMMRMKTMDKKSS